MNQLVTNTNVKVPPLDVETKARLYGQNHTDTTQNLEWLSKHPDDEIRATAIALLGKLNKAKELLSGGEVDADELLSLYPTTLDIAPLVSLRYYSDNRHLLLYSLAIKTLSEISWHFGQSNAMVTTKKNLFGLSPIDYFDSKIQSHFNNFVSNYRSTIHAEHNVKVDDGY